MHFPRLLLLATIVAGFATGAITHSRAALIAYDGFESYTVGNALGTNSGGSGWSQAWTSVAQLYTANATGGLNYAGGSVHVQGGSNAVRINTNGASSQTQEAASRRITPYSGDTLYFSVLYKVTSGLTIDDFVQFALNDNTDIQNSASIGDLNFSPSTSGTGSVFGTRIGGIAGGSTVNNPLGSPMTYVMGQTYFLVGKVSKTTPGAANFYNRIDLFVDPVSSIEPGTAYSYQTNSSGIATVNYFTLRTANLDPAAEFYFDELRIGTTFADVVPAPEPATWALMGFGLVAVLRGMQRRARR